MKWTTTRLMASGSFGVLRLILSLAGATLPAIFGIPVASGFINFIIVGSIISLSCLVIGNFGTATIGTLIFSILALPLPLLGPSGFVLKILVGLTTGLLADIIFALFKKNKKLASILTGFFVNELGGIELVWLLTLAKIPGTEILRKIVWSPLGFGAAIIGGGFSGYLGWLIYQKIKNTPIVLKIQNK